jgi:hypothetical protein
MPGGFRGSPAAFSGDDLIFVRGDPPHDDRLDNSVALNRLCQFHHSHGVELRPGLIGTGPYVIEGQPSYVPFHRLVW